MTTAEEGRPLDRLPVLILLFPSDGSPCGGRVKKAKRKRSSGYNLVQRFRVLRRACAGPQRETGRRLPGDDQRDWPATGQRFRGSAPKDRLASCGAANRTTECGGADVPRGREQNDGAQEGGFLRGWNALARPGRRPDDARLARLGAHSDERALNARCGTASFSSAHKLVRRVHLCR